MPARVGVMWMMRPVYDDVSAAVGQRHVLKPDVEACRRPVRAGCDVEGVSEHRGEAVVPLEALGLRPPSRRLLDARALLLRPRLDLSP